MEALDGSNLSAIYPRFISNKIKILNLDKEVVDLKIKVYISYANLKTNLFYMSTMICLKRIIFFLFREWYSYHFPELVKIINDNYLYAKTAKFIGNRKEFTEERVEELEEVVMDSGKARAIYDASRSSMGKCRISSIFVYCYEYINSHFYQIKLS